MTTAVDQRRGLEERLEAHLALMEKRTGCDDREAERLLERWDDLCADYDKLMHDRDSGGLSCGGGDA